MCLRQRRSFLPTATRLLRLTRPRRLGQVLRLQNKDRDQWRSKNKSHVSIFFATIAECHWSYENASMLDRSTDVAWDHEDMIRIPSIYILR